MLDSLLLSARCVVPVLLLIALGFLCRRIGWLRAEGTAQMDKVSFHVLLPTLLFQNIYTSDLRASFNGKMMLMALLLSLCTCGLSMLLSGVGKRDAPTRAALAQGMFRNNCVLYGLPIITALYGGTEAAGVFSMLLAMVIPLNNVLAVLIVTLLTSSQYDPKRLIKGIVTNPFVGSAVLGLCANLMGLVFPASIDKVIGNVASCATPIALMLLGASLMPGAVLKYRRDIAYGVGCKLLLWPLLFIPLMVAMGFRGIPLNALYLSIGTPCAVSAYTMAKEMGANGELAGHLVVFGAIGSILSIFLFLFAFSLLGLI